MTTFQTLTADDVDSGDLVSSPASDFAIRNVRAVCGDRIVDNATVVVNDGMIVDVAESGTAPSASIDGQNLLLAPGFVDTHSDGLEKEANPRRTAKFPLDYAIAAFEGRLRSSGVTTAFHGVGYQEKPRSGRTIDGAKHLNATIRERQATGRSLVDHRVLFRLEARDDQALEPMLQDLEAGLLGEVPLISFEDHTPGQGQYRDPSQYEAAISPDDLPDGMTAKQFVQKLMDDGQAKLETRNRNLSRLSPLARDGKIRMLAHDPDTADNVRIAHDAGASIAEFPVSIEAAEQARALGMATVMGAPNALRGASHSGNVSARELVTAGLCDVLASDYLPPAMVASVFCLAATRCCSLPTAIGLITSGPAALAGLTDRGEIAPGKRADLVLIDDRGDWPSIVGVRTSADDFPTLN